MATTLEIERSSKRTWIVIIGTLAGALAGFWNLFAGILVRVERWSRLAFTTRDYLIDKVRKKLGKKQRQQNDTLEEPLNQTIETTQNQGANQGSKFDNYVYMKDEI